MLKQELETRISAFCLLTRCALPHNRDRESTATIADVCDTIARFFQFPFRTPRWRASQVLVRSATDRSHTADHAPADPILMKSADVLIHCLTAPGDREYCIWSSRCPSSCARFALQCCRSRRRRPVRARVKALEHDLPHRANREHLDRRRKAEFPFQPNLG